MRKIILTLIALVVLGGCGTTTCLTYRGDVYTGNKLIEENVKIYHNPRYKEDQIYYYDKEGVGHFIISSSEPIIIKNAKDTLTINQ